MRNDALSLDQAPPLAVPLSFFVASACATLTGGVLLTWYGPAALSTNWAPATLALTHLGTLGVLNLTMLGALYQMTPVVAGARVPWLRLATVVLPAQALGLAGLCLGFFGLPGMVPGIACLALGFTAFIAPVLWALLRAPTVNETVRGMRIAVFSSLLVSSLGAFMAVGHVTHLFVVDRPTLLGVHLGLGLLGWVGGLLTAVSYQILPMFYLAPSLPRLGTITIRVGVLTSLVGLVLIALVGPWYTSTFTLALALAPGAIVVWLVHPALCLLALSSRRRPRVDTSLRYWRSALVLAPAVLLVGALTLFTSDARWPLLFGWLAVWGWASTVMRGMLCRIVPFLVWFHRYSALAGRRPIPSTRDLLPERMQLVGYALHMSTVALGTAAITLMHPWLAVSTGCAVCLSAIWLMVELITVANRYPDKKT